jgi:hypothetical protein
MENILYNKNLQIVIFIMTLIMFVFCIVNKFLHILVLSDIFIAAYFISILLILSKFHKTNFYNNYKEDISSVILFTSTFILNCIPIIKLSFQFGRSIV